MGSSSAEEAGEKGEEEEVPEEHVQKPELGSWILAEVLRDGGCLQ